MNTITSTTQRRVKASFKNVTPEQKAQFKNSRCLLTISVGQESHEGERFAATIDLVNETFGSCIISVHDSLQRYTMALNSTRNADDFRDASIQIGENWLASNRQQYNRLHNLERIIRWDEWLNESAFSAKKMSIDNLLAEDDSYKNIFGTTIDNYLQRYCRHLNDSSVFDLAKAKQLCFEYLIEECAVLCLWPELNCDIELYTGTHNLAMQETAKRFIASGGVSSLKHIPIKFNHRSNLRSQCSLLMEKIIPGDFCPMLVEKW